MTYECNCTNITSHKWDELMKGARKANKKAVIKAAIQTGILSESEGLKEIKLPYYNPYEHKRTKTHLIYVNSGIEHFIAIN
jgi:hypothetical protein